MYRSPIRIGERVLKNAVFSVVDRRLKVEHSDVPSLALKPETIVELEIVGLHDYKEVRIVEATGTSILVDLWGEPKVKQKPAGRPRKKPVTVE